jgi:hypothetical protein
MAGILLPQEADTRYAQAKNLSIAWGEYYQQRMDRAHRRYLSAIKVLALVRKLAVPVLQVNIGRRKSTWPAFAQLQRLLEARQCRRLRRQPLEGGPRG